MPLILHFNSFGDPHGRPLIIVHGLFGSARNWQSFARQFARNRWVITVDMRNHGSSRWNDDHSYHAMADDLNLMIDQFGGTADVLGHSMGGKAAIVSALAAPHKVNRLIIADIAPVQYQHSQLSSIHRMRDLPIQKIGRRSEAQKGLRDLGADPATAAFLAQNLILDGDAPFWKLNLAALEQNMDQLIGFPPVSGTFHKKTLCVFGEKSTYVDSTGKSELARLFPNLEFASIPDAGHWLHADNPKMFIQIVQNFLGDV